MGLLVGRVKALPRDLRARVRRFFRIFATEPPGWPVEPVRHTREEGNVTMSMMKAGLLALMIPAAMSAPVFAQQAGSEPPRMIFEELDADGNGSVTLEEVQAAGAGRFARADADGDGALSRAELIGQGQARVADRVDRMLERLDADGDGQLTQAEMEEAREGRERRGGRFGRGGPSPERMFERLDADSDGAVTQAEFDEGVARLLEGMGRRHGNGDN